MFVHNQTIPRPTLELLRTSTTEFYLTGSRRFGNARLWSSDWDFFTADTPVIREDLRKMGFSMRRAPGYEPDRRDIALVEVWTHHRDRIDVQIRRNVEEFETVCKMIEASGTLPPQDRILRMNYWNAMIRAAREIMKIEDRPPGLIR